MMLLPLLRIAPALLAVALASCGANDHSAKLTVKGKTMANAAVTKLTVSSDAFQNGHAIPAAYTCDGSDQRPLIHWSDPPAQTRSFALVIDDPDAPGGTFRHWGIFDIPVSARSIGGEQRVGLEVTNDFGKPGYGGPCPPKGHGPHPYHFKLFALDVERLEVGPGAKVADVESLADRHAIAKGELIGTYERK